ncbi:tyrosine--tRNA ligase [Candidatus Vidania fulgoroideorum]
MIKILKSRSLKEVINLKSIKNKKKLFFKFGIDPTSKYIHLGHIYILNTLRILQKKYKNIFVYVLIGDYTSKIGDPTKRFKKRKKTKINIKKFKNQIKKFLLKERTIFVYNSFWLKHLNLENFKNIKIKKLFMRKEVSKNINITIGEFIYPFLQNYDNKIIKPDIEIGGKDQKYNFCFIKKKICFFTFNLINAINSKKKMSSSSSDLKNINFKENEKSLFWKILKIKDCFIRHYLNFFKNKIKIKRNINKNIKKKLCLYYYISKELKIKKYKKILVSFLKKKDIYEKKIKTRPYILKEFILKFKILNSNNEIKRLIKTNSISLNKKKIKSINFFLKKGKNILKIGKKKFLLNVQEKI